MAPPARPEHESLLQLMVQLQIFMPTIDTQNIKNVIIVCWNHEIWTSFQPVQAVESKTNKKHRNNSALIWLDDIAQLT